MSLAIRAYRDGDLAAAVALWESCGILKPHHDPARELPFVDEAPNAELFLGFEGEKLAGSVLIGHDGHRAWMYRLAVDPGMRGHGYGRALVAHAESWAIARGLPKLMLLIRDGNESVADFYQRLGYGQEPRLVMSKSFGAAARPGDGAHLDVVITYLEMTERPTRPSLPAPSGVKLALLRVDQPAVAFYRFLYERVGDPCFWYERKHFPDERLAAILADPKVELYVPYVAGSPAGYFEIDRRPVPDVALSYFGLMPDYIGIGLGRYLLNWAIDTAWSSSPKRLTVDTCTLDHVRALQTYQRAGFKAYRQERKSIVDPRLTGKVPMHYEPILP